MMRGKIELIDVQAQFREVNKTLSTLTNEVIKLNERLEDLKRRVLGSTSWDELK